MELERLCIASGARSLSDLVRHAMRDLVRSANQDSALVSTVNQHAAQVSELEQKIEKLSAEIASLRGDAPVHEIKQTEYSPEPASRLDPSETEPPDLEELPSEPATQILPGTPASQTTKISKM